MKVDRTCYYPVIINSTSQCSSSLLAHLIHELILWVRLDSSTVFKPVLVHCGNKNVTSNPRPLFFMALLQPSFICFSTVCYCKGVFFDKILEG